MFGLRFKVLILAGAVSAISLPCAAQEIVAAAPSNQYALAAGDVAVSAVAQLNDAAETAHVQEK